MSNQSLRLRIRNILWSIRDNPKARLQLGIGIGVVVLIIAAALAVFFNQDPEQQTQAETLNFDVNAEAEKEVGIRFIDGVEVEAGKENLYPVSVMIENLVTVRPQAGLQQANVVYEALAEGGITRFIAVYAHDEEMERIGPVRSARPYYVDWATEYAAVYAHVGGSPQALAQLSASDDVVDLDQFANAQYYWRDPELPFTHSVFTSSELLDLAKRDLELDTASGKYSPWKFESEKDEDERRTDEHRITIPFSSLSYEVEYVYDAETNTYLRFNGGVEHTDALTEEQISVKNIVVQFTPTTLLEADTGRLSIETVGEGRAIVFRDGEAIEGEWRREDLTDRTRFYTAEGEEIAFNPGNIWIEVLPDDRDVEYN